MESQDWDLLKQEEYEAEVQEMLTKIEMSLAETEEWSNLEKYIEKEIKESGLDFVPEENDLLEIIRNAAQFKIDENIQLRREAILNMSNIEYF